MNASVLLLVLSVTLPVTLGPSNAVGAEDQKALTVAPQAQPMQTEAAGHHPGPANICRDLVAFLQPKPQAPVAGAAASPSGPAPQTSGQTAPIPQNRSSAQPASVTLEEASAYESANDLRACQQAVQKMRRAGVALPPGLLALAALRPELLTSGQP